MKTHPHLLVRDALARLFLDALRGDAEADTRLDALIAWSQATGASEAELQAIRAEDGTPLFEGAAPHERFAALAPFMRDRARRFAAARGWLADVDRSELLEQANACWDAGLFFEVHELLEPAWLAAEGARKETLQGLIMAGAGMHHLTEENLAGARGLLQRAARRLAESVELPDYDLPSFAEALLALHAEIEAGRVRGPADVSSPPRLEARSAAARDQGEGSGHR